MLLRQDKLQGELFQHHLSGYTTEKMAKRTSSWTSCTYLTLCTYILRILAMARDVLYENHANQGGRDQSIHLLSASYFLTKISKTLIKRSGHGDAPYVWKTTKGNRKKDIGKFVAVDVKSLEKSTESIELHLRGGNHRRHDSQTSRGGLQRIRMLHNLNHKNLHDILMKIPYEMSLFVSKKISLRTGSFLSLAHVLVTSLLSLGVKNNRVGVCWEDLLAVDAFRLYDTLHLNDSLSDITLVGTSGKFHVAKVSNIHLLWDSKKSFVSSCNKIKGAIRFRLGKIRNDMLPTTSYSFPLEELEIAMQSFTFDSMANNIFNMIESSNGKFNGINDKLVIQLKVLCLVLYMDDVKEKRQTASRMRMTLEPYSYPERLEHLVKFCHRKYYFNLVRDFNNNVN